MKTLSQVHEMINALTIDVEDYFNVSGFESSIRFEDWGSFKSRVERNTDRLLTVLNERGVKATFFVLGWTAENYPDLVRRIHKEKHEIASHSYSHRLIYKQTRKEFLEDLKRSKGLLENLIGEPVIGYRAPSYSIIKQSLWALDILMEEGLLYDSSIFPIRRDRYGIPNGNRFPYRVQGKNGKSIMEFPLSTVPILYNNIPIGGGGYLRLFPYQFTKWGLKRINRQEHQPAIVYLHPWEIDVDQPRIKGSFLSRFRHYIFIDRMEPRLKELILDFKFAPIRDLLPDYAADSHAHPKRSNIPTV